MWKSVDHHYFYEKVIFIINKKYLRTIKTNSAVYIFNDSETNC